MLLVQRLAASGGWLHLFPEARLLPWLKFS